MIKMEKIELIVTRDMARRYIENIQDSFGKNHAFTVALCGDKKEKELLKSRIAEWCQAYPIMTEKVMESSSIYDVEIEYNFPELPPAFDIDDEDD